jgi:hypothetical protein
VAGTEPENVDITKRRRSKGKVYLSEVEVKCTQSSTKYASGINVGVHSSTASQEGQATEAPRDPQSVCYTMEKLLWYLSFEQ